MASILITDDSMFMRALIAGALVQYGHAIVGEADDGADAVEKYKELKPDVVMMDLVMPCVDGVEAIRRIKALDPSARIVVCTAMNQSFKAVEAVRAGAGEYICKPFIPEHLGEAVRRIMEQ